MKKTIAIALFAITANAWAQTAVKIDNAWVRGTVAAQKATGAFMRIKPEANVRLVSAASPVAASVEIHQMSMDGDVMKMRQIEGLDLVAGRASELKPGGYHIMLMGLAAPVKAGDTVPLTLTFEDAAKNTFTQEVSATVRALGSKVMKENAKAEGEHKH